MWKMFKILENIGWVSVKPRLVAVQPAGCAPIVKAFSSDREDVEEWRSPKTSALGLKIPKPLAGRWILKTLRESHGVARAVTEDDIRKSTKRLARDEGGLIEPTCAAAFTALPRTNEDERADTYSYI